MKNCGDVSPVVLHEEIERTAIPTDEVHHALSTRLAVCPCSEGDG